MEVQKIIASFINGNKRQFYNQVKKYGAYDFFSNYEIFNYINVSELHSLFTTYLYFDDKK